MRRGAVSLQGGLLAAAIAVVGLAVPRSAHAQAPTAGGFSSEPQRQLEKLEQSLVRQPIQGPTVTGPERKADVVLQPGGPQFKLVAIKFDNSSFLSRAELDGLAGAYVGKSVDFSSLMKLVASVNALYATKGISSALATLPPQKVDGGRVKVKLTEGRIGAVNVVGAASSSPDFVKARIPLAAGEVVDPPRLQRDIGVFNRLHEMQLRALLQPGADFGMSDIQLAVVEPPKSLMQVFVDNQGVQSTGSNQIGSYFRHYGLFGVDDRLSLYAIGATGGKTYSGTASYSLPVNTLGTRVGVSFSQSKSLIIDGPYKRLDIESVSHNSALNLTHPLLVDQTWLVQASLSSSLGNSQSTNSGQPVTDDDTLKLSAGMSVEYQTETSRISVTPTASWVNARSNIMDTVRDFGMFSGTASSLFRFPGDLSLAVNGSWQATAEKLLPSGNLFQIGGPTTVRGFVTNSVAGDQGVFGNVEVHRNWPQLASRFDTFVFLDAGEVFSTYPSRRSIASTGVGVNWDMTAYNSLELTLATPIKTDVVADDLSVYARMVFKPQF